MKSMYSLERVRYMDFLVEKEKKGDEILYKTLDFML